MPEGYRNPFDDLVQQIEFCLDLAPNKVIEVFAKTLENAGIRVVLAAVSDKWTHPQVELTATLDDVTAKTVAQVADPVLRKAGVPESMVLMLSAAAGQAAVQALRSYANRQSQQQHRPTKQPAWDPSRMRRKTQ
jgi:hypothetical protein